MPRSYFSGFAFTPPHYGIGGGARLAGTVVTAPDLRGGAALVVAALAARGKTCVLDEGHIRRGYQALPDELAGLGAACRMA